jgi:hypothetical protein
MLAAWATGKTMLAIYKGILLSQIYKRNLGVIIRKVYRNLANSTMLDFSEYTGLKIPQGTKKVTIPGTTSQIIFMHAEDIEQGALQNINIGWAYIEQAEEFDSERQFDLLRGRLRRKLEPVMDFQAADPAYDDFIAELKAHPLLQIMVGANAAGHCWTWKKWIKDRKDTLVADEGPYAGEVFKAYELHEATSYDNWHNLPKPFMMQIASMKQDSPARYKRFVLNDHDEYDREGSYWGSSIGALRKKDPPQIGLVPFDPAYAVHTAWDVGYTTCFWYFQVVGVNRYYLGYYENQGEGIDFYCDLLHRWAEERGERGYRYGQHFGPWDISNPAHKATEGKTVQEVAEQHRIYFDKLAMDKDVNNSIQHARKGFPLSWFDAQKCEQGIDALEWFHEKKNERMSLEGRPYFTQKPEKDWSEHCAKAFIIADQGIPMIEDEDSSETLDKIHELQKRHGLVA